MKKYLCLAIIGLLFLAGCGREAVNEETESKNDTKNNEVSSDADDASADAVASGDLYVKVYDAYYTELSDYSELKYDGNEDLKHDCVALKDVFSGDYPELIHVSPYHYSKKGYIKWGDISFYIKTYKEMRDRLDTKILYADYGFITEEEKVKGYAALYKKDGTIVLHKHSDSFDTYTLIKDDGKERFLNDRVMKKQGGSYQIDEADVSAEEYNNNVKNLLDGLDCILLKDGVVSEEIDSEVKGIPSMVLNPHTAKVICQSEKARYSSDEIDKQKMWGEFAGTYSSSDGSSDAGVNLVIAKDGSFTGEYKSEPYDTDKQVDGISIKKRRQYAKFHGTFTNARRIDGLNYYIECNDFAYDNGSDSEVKDGVLYEYCEPNELSTFSQFHIYKAGSAMTDIPEDISWWYELYSYFAKHEIPESLDRNVIENIYTREFCYEEK